MSETEAAANLRFGETLEPRTICLYRAGERIRWFGLGNEECTGVIHQVRWMGWTWALGVWIDGENRQLRDGRPRLYWFPLSAENIDIERL